MTNRKNITGKLRLTPLHTDGLPRSDRDRLLRTEGLLLLTRREIVRLWAELAEAERGERLRREALFQILDEKDAAVRELEANTQ